MCHQAVAHITSGPVWDIWGKSQKKTEATKAYCELEQ